MQAQRKPPPKRWIVGAGLALLLLFVAFQAGKKQGRVKSSGPRTPKAGTFVLDIQFTFANTKDRDKFVELWRPLAKHVREKEPGTLSYELSVADSDPTKVLVFERYNSKDDYHHHKASKPFDEFHTKLRESGISWVSKQGQSFMESGVGYM